MFQFTPRLSFIQILQKNEPYAIAWVTGSHDKPQISGLVKFFQTPYGGVLIEAEVFGLPNISEAGSSDFYAMHIHEFGECTDQFASAGGHYNPTNQMHPMHAGDLMPLLANQGYGWLSFYDKRFTLDEILGKSVIIHALPDDFHTQPAGNSGERIACGVIRRNEP